MLGHLVKVNVLYVLRLHNCIYAINGQTNGRNYNNFESNLAMTVIYLPGKFEFDWTKHFRIRVRKQKC